MGAWVWGALWSGVIARANGELVEPGNDYGSASVGDMQGAGDLVERHGAAGKDAAEVEGVDAGEDVPDLGPRLPREFGRTKVASELGAGRAIGHAG